MVKRAHVLQSITHHPERLLWGLVGSILLFGTLYGYYLNRTVQNIVARKSIETSINELSTNIGDLEARYIALKEGITYEGALANGFVAVADPQFISRNTTGGLLTLNLER